LLADDCANVPHQIGWQRLIMAQKALLMLPLQIQEMQQRWQM
jgi:hypothetical protein